MSDLDTPRLIKGLHADYQQVAQTEVPHGIRCVGPHVLILCDECATVTTGGIHLPIGMQEKMSMASEQGVIADCAVGAFRLYEDGKPWDESERPKIGDRVYFEKYAGRQVKGNDGLVYRIMDYRCIA